MTIEYAEENKDKKATLGEIIRLLRKRKKIKLVDLAKKVKVTYVHLLNIEKDKKLPSQELLKKISKILSDDKEEEHKIYKKLLQYLIEKKYADLTVQSGDKQPKNICAHMPDVFLSILAQDYNKYKDKAVLAEINESIEQALEGSKYLSYHEVEKIADTFGLNKDIYLLLAGYIPRSDKEIFKTKATVENFLKLFDFFKSHYDTDKVLQAFLSIVQTFYFPQDKKEE